VPRTRLITALLLIFPGACAAADTVISDALSRLYNFDFSGAHRILDRHLAADPSDSLAFSMRAAAYLFSELDRLQILESEFFADDKRIIEKKKLQPDPGIRTKFSEAIQAAQNLAKKRLESDANDKDSLLTLAVCAGLLTDYAALVERRQFGSLSYAKESQRYAVRLLELDPTYYDAYLTTGLSEYLVGSLPFFVRWFVKFEAVEGSKEKAVRNLETVAKSGRYFGPFARILLSLIHLREKRPHDSERLLAELARDYPENPLIRKELSKISSKLRSGELTGGSN
jgi:hypothetical protein